MSNEINEVNEVIETLDSLINEESIQSQSNYILFDELKSQFNKISIPEILTIKKYLPIINKAILIDDIVSASKDIDDNGMTKINYINLELYTIIKIIEAYSDYGFNPDTMIEEVDYIIEHGIYDLIIKEIGTLEYMTINKLLDRELDQMIKVENGIEGIINKHLYLIQDHIYTLMDKIPNISESSIDKWMKLASKTIKNFDPTKHEMLNKMMSFSKGEDK